MIKLKKLKESASKKVVYKGNEYIVTSIDVDDDEILNTLIELKNDENEKSITLQAFVNGSATTNDNYINSLVNQAKDSREQEINQKVERPKIGF